MKPMLVTMRFSPLLLTACLTLAGCLGALQDMDHETDPAPEPAEVTPTGRTVELKVWVEDVTQEVWPGFNASFWAFCVEALPGSEDAVEPWRDGEACSVPGPTIRVQQGDNVRVHFENPHGFPHTIHWHGQTLPNEDDGVPGVTQDTVEPGGAYTYEYLALREGTLLYHCHVDTQHHVFMGLYGVIIVEPQDTSHEPAVDKEYTLILSHANKTMMDASRGGHHGGHHGGGHGGGHGGHSSGTPGKQNSPFETEYDVFMINGKSFPLTLEDPKSSIHVEPGERVRIRLANIGALAESMHLHGHDMLVTHKDGKALPEPYWADTVPILPGERYDVVVTADNPGKWVFHTHYTTHVSNDHQYPGGMLTHLVYAGYEDQTYKGELPGGGGAHAGHAGHDMGGMHGGHGGQGATPPPENHTATESDTLSGSGYEKEYEVPVEEGASVLRVNVSFTAGTPLDEITVTLLDPDGEEVGAVTASAGSEPAEIEASGPLAPGAYKVRVEGQGVGAEYELRLFVGYGAGASTTG